MKVRTLASAKQDLIDGHYFYEKQAGGLGNYFLDSLGYNVYTLQQAARRSWRIGQTEDVKVIYLGYENSAQTDCLALMAKNVNQREKLTSFRNKSARNIDHLPGM